MEKEFRMERGRKFKAAIAGLVAGGILAFGMSAQAVTLDMDPFRVGAGDALNPIVITIDPASGFFTDTINFDLGSFTHFNMTSTSTNLTLFFGVPIFDNNLDEEVPGTSANTTHVAVFLPDLGLAHDYHLHPVGINDNIGGGNYTLTMWGSAAPVPVPAAVYLFGTGLIGLAGLARRRMKVRA